MVIKPYGYAIWENMQAILDQRFKELGVQNCYFPLFIPIDLFAKEATHVSGFAKEMAIVTHSKLESIDGKLVPSSPIEVPLAVRPTSEMIIGESFSKWIKSYRDMPILVNQWCNVVRWEMRTRIFLRTMEFLWQEGHTVFETEKEALQNAVDMHNVYNWFITDVLKMNGIMGRKPAHERFPGAVETLTIESMMQDGKALQGATSHYLGQHFAKAVDIRFQARDESLQYAHTSSWGISTRIIGGLIMAHGDDDGINVPTSIAPHHIVIIPTIKDVSSSAEILEYCEKIRNECKDKYRVFVDTRAIQPQDKRWSYIKKGVPVICEIGAREVDNSSVFFTRRQPEISKSSCDFQAFKATVSNVLSEHDDAIFRKSNDFARSQTSRSVRTLGEMKEFFSAENAGFVIAPWSGDEKSLELISELGVTVRCSPVGSLKAQGKCVLTGKDANTEYVFARSY
jgi:prolyl-tRNA synthetase